MTAKAILRLSAICEGLSGAALIAFPDFVVRELFAGGLSSDVLLARGAGIGPLVLGLLCWPGEDDVTATVLWAQFAYSVFIAFYLGYLKLAGGFNSVLLWPMCALHGLLSVMLGSLTFQRASRARA
jgi:hypothetical protein